MAFSPNAHAASSASSPPPPPQRKQNIANISVFQQSASVAFKVTFRTKISQHLTTTFKTRNLRKIGIAETGSCWRKTTFVKTKSRLSLNPFLYSFQAFLKGFSKDVLLLVASIFYGHDVQNTFLASKS